MRSHQSDVTALTQWKPLIHKISYQAAKRAVAIGLPMTQADFVQELSVVCLKCHDSYNPDMGASMMTFLYRAMYNEVNKIFTREESGRKISHQVVEVKDRDGVMVKRVVNDLGFNISGDTTYNGEEGPVGIWDHIEDIGESPEAIAMEDDLQDYLHARIHPDASVILCILESGNSFIGDQLAAYNDGVTEEAQAGGIRRLHLDLDFAFVGKLLGYDRAKIARHAAQVKKVIQEYGA